MKPQMSKTLPCKLWKLAYRFPDRLKTRWTIALLPLLPGFGGCALPMPTSAAGAAGVYAFWASMPIIILDLEIKQQQEYEAHYRDSDYAAITMVKNTPKASPAQSLLHAGSFYFVDDQEQDQAGFVFPAYGRIFIPPGTHRLVVAWQKNPFYQPVISAIEVAVMPRHAYSLSAVNRDDGYALQLWDETAGPDRRTLQREYTRLPAVHGLIEAARVLRIRPDSAVVVWGNPAPASVGQPLSQLIQPKDSEPVTAYFPDRKDGVYPGIQPETYVRFVPAGTHHVILGLRDHRMIPLSDVLDGFRDQKKVGAENARIQQRMHPKITVCFQAGHIYRISARWVNREDLVQIWDETDGLTQHALAQEFRFADPPSPAMLDQPDSSGRVRPEASGPQQS